MAYIGRNVDKISNVEVLDNITFDGSSSYTLQKNSVNFTPSSANTLLVSIDGVVQAGNFTVSGSTIDFGTAVAGTSTCDFILHYGVGLITTPADGTVTTAKLADSSVSLAKLTATGTKDGTTFLRGDNTFASAGLSGWSEDGANNNLLPASASAGIYLGVTSATAANLLDDYEEGTFTPIYRCTGDQLSSVTYNAWTGGRYTKVGQLVSVTGTIASNAVTLGSPSGNLRIGGLPFTVAAVTGSTLNTRGAVVMSNQNLWSLNNTPNNGNVVNGTTEFDLAILYGSNDDAAAVASTDITTGSVTGANRLFFTVTYMTDA